MQIKRSVTVGCDTSFRCRSIWKNLPVTGSSGKRGNYIYEDEVFKVHSGNGTGADQTTAH